MRLSTARKGAKTPPTENCSHLKSQPRIVRVIRDVAIYLGALAIGGPMLG